MPIYQWFIRKTSPLLAERLSRLLGLLARGKIKSTVNGACMMLDLGEVIQRRMFLGVYEPEQTKWARECVGPGDICIDIGASFGHYATLFASLVGPDGKIFAFEPSPLASKVLEDMIHESNIHNIDLIKAAVGEKNGFVNLFLPTTKYLYSPSIMESDPSFSSVEIPVIALDTFQPLKQSNKIKIMKIDVEGYEPNVLEGMKIMLKNRIVENIFCEFNSWWLSQNSTTTNDLFNIFSEYGYVIYKKTEHQKGLKGHKGSFFDLQDVWFKLNPN